MGELVGSLFATTVTLSRSFIQEITLKKSNQEKTQRKIDRVLLYTAVIANTLNVPQVRYNGVPVSESVIRTAISDEVYKLVKVIGLTDERFKENTDSLDWSETSLEFIEFNDMIGKAIAEVNSALDENEREKQ